MADLLLGAAVILPNHRLKLVIGVGICKALCVLVRRRPQNTIVDPSADSNGEIDTNSKDTSKDTESNKPVTVTWEDLTCTLTTASGGSRNLLHNLNGAAQPGRLLAILGASGSGKTTLLTALAGQVASSPKLTLHGHITVNSVPQQQSRTRQAFVQQVR